MSRHVGLRACVAISAGCRRALAGAAEIDPTRQAIVRLGKEAAAELAAIPNTPEMRARDRVYRRPTGAGRRRPCPAVLRMRQLIERYRCESRIDIAVAYCTLAERLAELRPRRGRTDTGAT